MAKDEKKVKITIKAIMGPASKRSKKASKAPSQLFCFPLVEDERKVVVHFPFNRLEQEDCKVNELWPFILKHILANPNLNDYHEKNPATGETKTHEPRNEMENLLDTYVKKSVIRYIFEGDTDVEVNFDIEPLEDYIDYERDDNVVEVYMASKKCNLLEGCLLMEEETDIQHKGGWEKGVIKRIGSAMKDKSNLKR